MANEIPNLLVYTPITGTSTFVEDIAPYAVDYQHSIRLLGGYWTATWKLYKDTDKQKDIQGIGPTLFEQWRSNRFFHHFVENFAGQPTWEGSIEGIQPDNDKGILDITAYGYVHSIQNRYNSTTDASTTDADSLINIFRFTDCEFIPLSQLQANTLQVYKAGGDKIWDEMLKIVELGDGSTWKPWQLGVYQDRRLIYQAVSTTPLGYVRTGMSGGVRWRIDGPNDVINYVIVRYTDETGAAQTDITAESTESINRYGRREKRLERTYLPTASATALASQYLYEHMWPYMRAIGCGRDIQVYDSIGCNNAGSPWVIQPGVFMDTTVTPGENFWLSWLPAGCFLADEVVASAKGVQLRTSKWNEADMMDAYYDYARETGELDYDLSD